MPFSCDRSTVHSECVGSGRRLCRLFLRQKCLSAHELQFFLNLCIFGSRGGIFNPADVEFKRETIIPLFPQVPYSVFCFVLFFLPFPFPLAL